MLSRELSCKACGWRTVCGLPDLISRLRLVGVLRRAAEPAAGLVAELLPDAVGRMTCPRCKEIGLTAAEVEPDDDADDWLAAVLCERCRKPIPPERLEALPGAKRCVACQGESEAPGDDDALEPDFCPKCGALVELRVSRGGGLTRYRQFCTAGCRI
ncbi:TraR/DksA C4-type zinc finger protein [Pseudobythopirellula maris]|nr:TraR/DksA C4-type zinc finger protein [Pseudobythopirellula maris]